MKDKKGQAAIIDVVSGILLIGGGAAFIVNQTALGGILAAVALTIEAVKIFMNSI